MPYVPSSDLSDSDYVLIDIDSGTIVSANVKLVRLDNVPESFIEAAYDSDSEARSVAEEFGEDLFALLD